MKLFYHIGYPRTATTLLQSSLFPKHKDINYLGAKYYNNEKQIFSFEKLYLLGSLYTSYEIKNNEVDFDKIDKIIDLNVFDKNKANIISSEHFSNYTNLTNFNEIKIINKYLNKKYKDVDINFILTIRNQYDLIKSLFYHSSPIMPKDIGAKSFNELLGFFKMKSVPTYKTNRFYSIIKYFDFNYIYDFLQENFSSSKIHILIYEDLLNNKDDFFNKLSEILNIDNKISLELVNKLSDENYIIMKSRNINQLKDDKNIIIYHKNLKFYASRSKIFNKLKFLIPRFIKNLILLLMSTKIKPSINESQERIIIDDFFKKSNYKFFKKINRNNLYKKY
jgi:hypothetical protein